MPRQEELNTALLQSLCGFLRQGVDYAFNCVANGQPSGGPDISIRTLRLTALERSSSAWERDGAHGFPSIVVQCV